MSPQVIAVDELGEEQDLRVLHMAASGGCSLLATVHGAGEEDAARRLGGEYMREMFARIVILKGRGRMECRCLEGG
jgi:stage III sporulation protein AA